MVTTRGGLRRKQFDCREYLNNIIEQDHRRVKRITRSMLDLKSFHSAQGTRQGIGILLLLV